MRSKREQRGVASGLPTRPGGSSTTASFSIPVGVCAVLRSLPSSFKFSVNVDVSS
jgi:hypothetical protein